MRKDLSLNRVAECLYRLHPSGMYYALVKRHGKQIKRSLKTTDRQLAERRLRDFQGKAETLQCGKGRVAFGVLVEEYRQTVLAAKDLKPASLLDTQQRLNMVLRKWPGLDRTQIGDIGRSDCERWFAKRKAELRGAQRLKSEVNLLKSVFDFAIREGYLLDNPARAIKPVRVPKTHVVPPTRDQFLCLVNHLRSVENHDAADFVELLAYSGMRRNEAAFLIWGEVEFSADRLIAQKRTHGAISRLAICSHGVASLSM